MTGDWAALAVLQEGVLARRQLTALGCGWDRVDSNVTARRWAVRTSRVVSTFTGELTWRQRVWTAVLHAGGPAVIGGLTALEWQGLRSWHRDDVTVLVDDQLSPEPVPGVRFFRTRRDLAALRHGAPGLPLCRVEAAALLFAGYDRSPRTAQGVFAAAVQLRLTTAERLIEELPTLRPLRRSRLLRTALLDMGSGAQSVAELDVRRMCRRAGLPLPRRQVGRRDSAGRMRFTDCEWALPDGTALILEVDGGFHMDVEHWEADMARHRRLALPGRVVVRCSSRELRDEPDRVAADLVALGLPRSWA